MDKWNKLYIYIPEAIYHRCLFYPSRITLKTTNNNTIVNTTKTSNRIESNRNQQKRNLLCVYATQKLRRPFESTAKRTSMVLLSFVAVGEVLSITEVFLRVLENTNIAIAYVSFRFC